MRPSYQILLQETKLIVAQLLQKNVCPDKRCVRACRVLPYAGMSEGGFRHAVFLSHCDDDRSWVRWFAAQLTIQGCSRFYSPDSIPPGSVFTTEIERAIKSSRWILVFLSPAAIKSPWVSAEIAVALDIDPDGSLGRVIPVFLQEVPEASVPKLLTLRQYITLFDHTRRDAELARLLAAIGLHRDSFGWPTDEDAAAVAVAPPPPRAAVAADAATQARLGRVAVFGLGYVGLSLAAMLAVDGFDVVGIERKKEKLDWLFHGQSHLYEPGVADLLRRAHAEGRFHPGEYLDRVQVEVDVIVLCLGPDAGWKADAFERALQEIGEAIRSVEIGRPVKVVLAGTIRPEDVRLAEERLVDYSVSQPGEGFVLAVSPLFVREGEILADLRRPPFIVTGTDDGQENAASRAWRAILAGILDPDLRQSVPCLHMKGSEACVLKLASNAFHAMKVVFANEIGRICRALRIDTHVVMDAFVQDRVLNISARYLRPGFAFGGSCLEKDIRGLLRTAPAHETPLLSAIVSANQAHLARAIELITNEAQLLRKTRIGLFGVTFKVGSDDVRFSPSLELVRALAGKYQVGAFDEDLMKAPELTGVNLDRWSELRADHPIEMFTSRAALLRACDIVVLAKAGAISRADLETSLTRDQAVVDLVGDLAGVTLKQRVARLT